MSNPIVLLIFRVCFYGALLAGCVLAFSPLDRALHANFDDKLLHYAGFFVLGLLSFLSHPRVPLIWLALMLSGFGLFIEVVQAYIPFRSFSLADWAADAAGACSAYLLIVFILLWAAKKS